MTVIFVARNVRNVISAGPPTVSYPTQPMGNAAVPITMTRLKIAKSSQDDGFIGRGEKIFDGSRRTKSRRDTAAATRTIADRIQRPIMNARPAGELVDPVEANSASIPAAVVPICSGYTTRHTAVRRTHRITRSPEAM